MKSLKVTYENGVASIDWGAVDEGIDTLKHRAVNHLLTRAGTDKIVPSRGTHLDKRLMSMGAFDAVGIQHELNFAAIAVFNTLREFSTTDPDSSIASFRVVFSGYAGNRAATKLQIINAAGDRVGLATEL